MNLSKLLLPALLFSSIALFVSAAEPPEFRGAMISPHNFHEADLEVLGKEWNANLVRWQLNWGFPHGKADTASIEEYFVWLEDECKLLDAMIPFFRTFGVKVCLDVHTAPGGFNERNVNRAFEEKEFTEAFVETWIRLASRYKNQDVIWAYDLLNEPVEDEPAEGQTYHISWHDLAERTAIEIRRIDGETPIIFEPSGWANPAGFDGLEPLNLSNIIYSVHMYIPHAFTHQGVSSVVREENPVAYPGEISGVYWNKEKLREALAPVLSFQNKYGVPIFVGEFSAIRWAPENGAYNYLKDVIDIFEEYGWNWTYHAFREWSGWSVEYTDDRTNNQPSAEPTNRETLLKSYFQKNTRSQK